MKQHRYLISTKPRIVRCKLCHCVIWFCYSQGEPTYCDTEDLDLREEIAVRVAGRRTYNYRPGHSIYERDEYTINHKCAVFVAHIHRNGFYDLERTCRTETKKKGIDLSTPPF